MRDKNDQLAEKEGLSKELHSLRGEMKGVQDQLRDKSSTIDKLEGESRKKEDLYMTIQQTLQEQRNSIGRLEREKEQLESGFHKKTAAGAAGGDTQEIRNQLRQQQRRVEELNQELAIQRTELDRATKERDDVVSDCQNAISSKKELVFVASEEIEKMKEIINMLVLRNWRLSQKPSESGGGMSPLGDDLISDDDLQRDLYGDY